MKACSYCGTENEADVTTCSSCGFEFAAKGPPELPKPAPRSVAQLLFSSRGRIGRQTLWLTSAGVYLLFGTTFPFVQDSFLVFVWALLFLGISVSLQMKRWHDRGKSGAMVLINLIPIVGPFWTLAELGFLPGTIGRNRYGADPLEPQDTGTEEAGYRLLEQATRFELAGQIPEALLAYDNLASRYANTAAGRDAAKSAENLRAMRG